MKIALVENVPEGGAKRVVYEQVKGLSQHHTVYLYTNHTVTSFPFEHYASQIYRYELKARDFNGWQRPLHEIALFTRVLPTYQRIAEAINRSDADIALIHPDMETQAPMILSLLTKPSVYFIEEWLRFAYEPELHPLNQLKGIKKLYEQGRRKLIASIDALNVAKATTLLTSSQFNALHIKTAYQRLVEIIPLGVDTALFKPAKNPTRDYFLFVGHKTDMDGYDLITDMMSLSPNQPNIITVDHQGKGFKQTDTELVHLYQHAVATLGLSRQEPFGLTALESMACGTPVIAVNEGGYRETVTDGVNGVLISRQSETLLKAMRELAKDKEHYVTLSTQARKTVQAHFLWEQHIERLTHALQEVVDD